MRHHESPDIGKWFKDGEFNTTFEVVATDEIDDCVEIQYFAGEIEEIDLNTWYDLDLISIPAPEDWSGPYEMTHDDLGYDDTIHPEDWAGPLVILEPK